mgnify:CR=1 FL=1
MSSVINVRAAMISDIEFFLRKTIKNSKYARGLLIPRRRISHSRITAHSQGCFTPRSGVVLDCGLWFCYEKPGDGESTILRAYFSYDNSNMP